MELALVTVLGLVGLAVLLAPVFALVALVRSAVAARRLDALAREVRELRAVVAGEGRGERAPRPEPPPAAVVAPPPPPPPPARPAAPPPPPRPAAPPPPPPPPSPPPARLAVDWERLFGVRAAAVLGGIALALAGLLFFKYSIEHGLIPPWLRVVLGTVVGLGCVVGSERTLRARYEGTANALAGAGVVILYAAFWAASVRYRLIGITPGFVLMLAVTAACCVLSWRHASQVIALLGLVGGFATPLLLSTGADRPLGLFGYVLLLDAALLYLAQRRRWPALTLLSLAGTVAYEALWIATRMGPDRLPLGLGILAVFAIFFAAAGRIAPAEDRPAWLAAQAAGVLVPFAFALFLAGPAGFGPHLYPYAMLLAVLSAAAGWLGRVQRSPRLGLGAAGGSLGVVAVWLLTRTLDAPLAWESAAVCVALAAVLHAFAEWDPERAEAEGPAGAAVVSSVGFFVLLILAMDRANGTPWPWVAGWAGLTALLLRHASLPRRERLQLVAAGLLGVGLAWLHAERAEIEAPPALGVYLGLMLAAAVAFQVVALRRRAPRCREIAEHAAAALAALLLLQLVPTPLESVPPPGLLLGTSLALGLLVALAATRLGAGAWLLAAVLLTALVHTTWTTGHPVPDAASGFATGGLVLQGVAVLLFTAWPFLVADRFRGKRLAWHAAALAGPAWFLGLRRLFEIRFGDGAIGLLPLLLGAVALAGAWRVRDLWPADDRRRTVHLAWFAAVALGFVSVAIPLQLEKEWITIGWALEGLAVVYLWTRLDHAGLKYFGLALVAATTARLVANPAVLGYYPRPAWRIVNWLAYTYLVPAAALLAAGTLLQPREIARASAWERERVYRHEQPWGAVACGLAGLVVVFVWINLAVADWFATGATLRVSFERLPARDLTTSIAWAVYALVLLALGMARASTGLRWASLALLLVTIAKVFLHDLGELRDLYRVASLAGLAVSLLLVSVAYQRFVFRTLATEKT